MFENQRISSVIFTLILVQTVQLQQILKLFFPIYNEVISNKTETTFIFVLKINKCKVPHIITEKHSTETQNIWYPLVKKLLLLREIVTYKSSLEIWSERLSWITNNSKPNCTCFLYGKFGWLLLSSAWYNIKNFSLSNMPSSNTWFGKNTAIPSSPISNSSVALMFVLAITLIIWSSKSKRSASLHRSFNSHIHPKSLITYLFVF